MITEAEKWLSDYIIWKLMGGTFEVSNDRRTKIKNLSSIQRNVELKKKNSQNIFKYFSIIQKYT